MPDINRREMEGAPSVKAVRKCTPERRLKTHPL
jgi:hypothetical protein